MSKQFEVGKQYKIVDESKLTNDTRQVLLDVTLPKNKTFTCSSIIRCNEGILGCITQTGGVYCYGIAATKFGSKGVGVVCNLDLESGAVELIPTLKLVPDDS